MKRERDLNLMNTCLIGLALILLLGLYSPVLAGKYESAKQRADSIAEIIINDFPSEEDFDSSTTLADYLIIAMKRNLALKSAYYDWVSELNKTAYAGSLPDPMFSFSYFIENVETRVGPQESRFSLKQSFPWFGTLGARKDIALASAQASWQRFESERLKLFYQVKSAYYEFYLLGQDLQITKSNFELLTFWESVARSKYEVGMKQYPDIIKAQVELGKLEDHIQTLRERIKPVAAGLRALLDLDDTIELPIPGNIELDEKQLDDALLIENVKSNNPNLKALAHLIDREDAGVRLANKLSLPSFTLGVDYIRTGDAINPDLAESGKDPWMVGVGISVPIWFGKNSARKNEAKARKNAVAYNVRNSTNQLTALTREVLFEYSDALRKMKLYRDGLVPKAEQSLNASYTSYQAGKTDFLNVLDAQRQLLDFELTVAREKAELAKKSAELEMLSGKEISNFYKD